MTSGLCVTVTVLTSIISIILFAISFSDFGPTQLAIRYDRNLLHIDSKKLFVHGGRFFQGIGQGFLKFSSIYRRSHLFGIVVRSSDGLPITMDYSFTYQLNANMDDVYRFYLDFGPDGGEVSIVEDKSRQAIMNAASRFEAFDFFLLRDTISDTMLSELDRELGRIYLTPTTFQITSMSVPNDFADVIEATQIAIQNVIVAEYEQNKTRIAADGLVAVQTQLANITVLTANADALSLIAEFNSQADALMYRVSSQTESLYNLSQTWNLSTVEVLSYMHMAAIKETKVPTLNMGQKYPSSLQSLSG